MKRLLLTSTGFVNKAFSELFLNETGIPADKIKVLFIPTAAIDDAAKAVLPKCYSDLTGCGIIDENITVYDLDRHLCEEDINKFNAIYVCGGSPEYLLKRMNEVNFKVTLSYAFKHKLIYIGVSAGSIVCGSNLENNLGLFAKDIRVHCTAGSSGYDFVNLTNKQAIWIFNDRSDIIE